VSVFSFPEVSSLSLVSHYDQESVLATSIRSFFHQYTQSSENHLEFDLHVFDDGIYL
jgi:hypothetical protein